MMNNTVTIIGAGLAILALHCMITMGLPIVEQSLSFLSFSISQDVLLKCYGALLGAGVLIGIFGSAITMRRYLKA
jgi:cell division transport system permease protein